MNAAEFSALAYLETAYAKIRAAATATGKDPEAEVTRYFDEAKGGELRRTLTRADPLLFALTYFRHHLKSDATGGKITFGDAHLDWAEHAKRLMVPVSVAGAERDAYVAPREMGKSTWQFLIIPAWAAAHGWSKFIVAFADAADQAETHLASFKTELENNAYLRADYPDLVAPMKRERGVVAADRVSLYRAQSGFIFAARGMETKTLGLKVGALRPDYILLDDIEPGEEKYSGALVKKRLGTLQDTILPLNDKARVVWVGTVTMAGSLIHQLVKAARGLGTEPWIAEDGWRPHYYAPIVPTDDGQRSIWPARWPLERLLAIAHTRSYLKNYANDPLGADGDYWTADDFRRAPVDGMTRCLISVDPAVTTKDSSDFTGIAVVGWRPGKLDRQTGRRSKGVCQVKRAEAIKKSGSGIREHIIRAIETDPTIGLILVETNQGGEVWREILWGMPVPVKTKHQSVKKEVRAARVLNHYQLGRVYHADGLAAAEEQMVSFPDGPHDDIVDAVGTGISYFLDKDAGKVKVTVAKAA